MMKKNADNSLLVHDHLMKNVKAVVFAEPWMIPAAMFLTEAMGYMMKHGIKRFLIIAQKRMLEMEWLPLLKGGEMTALTYAIAMNKESRKVEAFNSGMVGAS